MTISQKVHAITIILIFSVAGCPLVGEGEDVEGEGEGEGEGECSVIGDSR